MSDRFQSSPPPSGWGRPAAGWTPASGRAAPGATYDQDLRSFMLGVFNLMAGGLALTGLVAWGAVALGFYRAVLGTPVMWLVVLAPVALALVLGFGIARLSPAAARAAFWGYAALMGLSLGTLFLVYTGTSIARVFFIAAGTFAATAAWGATTKTDLSRFGSFLVMGLVGVVLASVVNIFLGSSTLQFAVSVIGVLVFTGLTAWDTQRLREVHAGLYDSDSRSRAVVMGALTLYLDFVNLFTMLLQLTGTRRD